MLEAGKRGPALKNRSESTRWSRDFKDTLRPHFKRAQSILFWRKFTICSSEERKHGDGQVDRQDLTAPEASTRCLDGHVADVLQERTGDHPLKVVSILLPVISMKPRESD